MGDHTFHLRDVLAKYLTFDILQKHIQNHRANFKQFEKATLGKFMFVPRGDNNKIVNKNIDDFKSFLLPWELSFLIDGK